MELQFDKFMKTEQKFLVYLFDRWQDEKEYENFSDYKHHAGVKLLEFGLALVSMKSKPFELRVKEGDQEFVVRVTSKAIKAFDVE